MSSIRQQLKTVTIPEGTEMWRTAHSIGLHKRPIMWFGPNEAAVETYQQQNLERSARRYTTTQPLHFINVTDANTLLALNEAGVPILESFHINKVGRQVLRRSGDHQGRANKATLTKIKELLRTHEIDNIAGWLHPDMPVFLNEWKRDGGKQKSEFGVLSPKRRGIQHVPRNTQRGSPGPSAYGSAASARRSSPGGSSSSPSPRAKSKRASKQAVGEVARKRRLFEKE